MMAVLNRSPRLVECISIDHRSTGTCEFQINRVDDDRNIARLILGVIA